MAKTRTFKDWVDKSWKLPGVVLNPFLAIDLQSLGRLDVDLVEQWKFEPELIVPPTNEKDQLFNIQESLRQQKSFEYSRLWVLAGYEIAMQLKNNDPEKFRDTYNLFRKVRVPLVRYEKAGKNGDGQQIAMPGINTDIGEIGWEIEQGVFVTRNELAEKLFGVI